MSDPDECRTASVFVTYHHECVQTLPPAPTSPLPTVPAGATVTLPAVAGVPTVAPPQGMVPAGEALMSTSTAPAAAATSAPGLVNTSQAEALPAGAAALVPTIAPLVATTTTTMDAMQINEQYIDRRDRFIRAPDGRVTWFQDAQTLTKHLVRTGCKACGTPPPCQNWLSVSHDYIHNLSLGEDFQCEMLSDESPNGFSAPAYPTTSTMPQIEFAETTTTTQAAAAGGGFGTWLLGAIVVLCCCAGAGGAAFWAMNNKGGRKASKKGKKTRAVKRDASESGVDEDQVPLVIGQENGSFSSQASYPGEPVAQMGQREQMAAMAPTYTAMTPQMGQAQMAAQMATMQGLPTYPAMQTQAAFGQEQEMELVTVTPNGLAVTALAPGQQVPAGVPVLNQAPPQYAQPQPGMQYAQPQPGMPPPQYGQPPYGMQMPGY